MIYEVRIEEWREKVVKVEARSHDEARAAALHPVRWLDADLGSVVHIEPHEAHQVTFDHEDGDAMAPDPMQAWHELRERLRTGD